MTSPLGLLVENDFLEQIDVPTTRSTTPVERVSGQAIL